MFIEVYNINIFYKQFIVAGCVTAAEEHVMAAAHIANFDVDLLGSEGIKEATINAAAIVYRGLSERHLSKQKTGEVLPGFTPISVCISFQGVAISKREFPIRGDHSLFHFSLSQITYCGSDKTYPANVCFVAQKRGNMTGPLCVVLRTESPSKSQAIIKSFQKICKEKMRAKEEQEKNEVTGTSL